MPLIPILSVPVEEARVAPAEPVVAAVGREAPAGLVERVAAAGGPVALGEREVQVGPAEAVELAAPVVERLAGAARVVERLAGAAPVESIAVATPQTITTIP